MCAYMHICAHICIYARSYAYMLAYMHKCSHICIYACIYAYMRAIAGTFFSKATKYNQDFASKYCT